MPAYELVFGVLLVIVVLGVVVFFSWQELRNLARLRREPAPPAEEQHRVRSRARRRLICCGLLLVLAGQIVGAYYLDAPLRRLFPDDIPSGAPLDHAQRSFARLYTYYWIFTLLVFLAVIFIAGYDLWVLRRWSIAAQRQLHQDRRDMIQEEVALYRRQRNGKQH